MSTSLSPLCTVMYVLVVQNWSLQRKAIHACHFHAWLPWFQVQIKSIAWLCCKSTSSLEILNCVWWSSILFKSYSYMSIRWISCFSFKYPCRVQKLASHSYINWTGLEHCVKCWHPWLHFCLFCECLFSQDREKGRSLPCFTKSQATALGALLVVYPICLPVQPWDSLLPSPGSLSLAVTPVLTTLSLKLYSLL